MPNAKPKPLRFREGRYLIEIVKGLGTTFGHLMRNLRNPGRLRTVAYPVSKNPFPVRFRAALHLAKHEDGSPRCTACMCCATSCPAGCIHIVAGEYPDRPIEKFPVKFDIDMLKCVECSLCVEACPCDAIRMDTGLLPMPAYDRKDFLYDKARLMSHEPAVGPDGYRPRRGDR